MVRRLFKMFFRLLYTNSTARNKIKLHKWIKDKICGSIATNQLKILSPQFSYLKYKLNLYPLFLWAWKVVSHPKRRTKKGKVLRKKFRAENLKITDRNLVKMWEELNKLVWTFTIRQTHVRSTRTTNNCPSGATHRLPTIVIYNFYNPNALESLVITPDVPPSHTYTPLLTSNPFMSSFTVWRINFSTTVLLTLNLLSAIYGTTLCLIFTSSIENTYINGLNIFCCNLSSSGCSVFSIVIIFHCWNIEASYIYSHEYPKWYCWKLAVGTIL